MGNTKEELKIGDRVILTSRFYKDSYYNPVFGGSNGYITGTVDNLNIPGLLKIGVLWDNGKHNCYKKEDLEKLKTGIDYGYQGEVDITPVSQKKEDEWPVYFSYMTGLSGPGSTLCADSSPLGCISWKEPKPETENRILQDINKIKKIYD